MRERDVELIIYGKNDLTEVSKHNYRSEYAIILLEY